MENEYTKSGRELRLILNHGIDHRNRWELLRDRSGQLIGFRLENSGDRLHAIIGQKKVQINPSSWHAHIFENFASKHNKTVVYNKDLALLYVFTCTKLDWFTTKLKKIMPAKKSITTSVSQAVTTSISANRSIPTFEEFADGYVLDSYPEIERFITIATDSDIWGDLNI